MKIQEAMLLTQEENAHYSTINIQFSMKNSLQNENFLN